MRLISTKELYSTYFKHKFKSAKNMGCTFVTNKNNDKEGKNKNRTYLEAVEYGYYNYEDLLQYFRNKDEEHNTIVYCSQLLVDIEGILDLSGVKGGKGMLAKTLGITQSQLTYHGFSYELSKELINKIETRVKNMSPEGIKELKYYYERYCNGDN